MTEENYRPKSPDLSSLPFPPTTTYTPLSPLTHRASCDYDSSPFFSSPRPQRVPQSYVPPSSFEDMARRSSRLQYQDAPQYQNASDDLEIEAETEQVPEPQSKTMTFAPEIPEEKPAPAGAGIEVKTKFPVARIKRIMQADEDVGKVAQVTPIAVSKALELFMISLVTKAAYEAQERNSKRITASHLKLAVSKDETLDFLADIMAKVPDQPARKNEDESSDQNDGRKKRGGRKPKEESE
ncbi:hypothetical protein N7495_001451 [Penicillium taxi]|uniref:uncharacterized protein n=1 Tax=Penicillium taxi TaxID=168475 RepID=UPI002545B894|nr:uncharacterized protein N7495_001451 [Penicillium taxi]KAJ5908769.1 hypothetical protein N7495_001451 [Penicillium taxi]